MQEQFMKIKSYSNLDIAVGNTFTQEELEYFTNAIDDYQSAIDLISHNVAVVIDDIGKKIDWKNAAYREIEKAFYSLLKASRHLDTFRKHLDKNTTSLLPTINNR
jgi:hypothetical protein